MADRQLLYRVALDLAQARTGARQLSQIYQNELRRIDVRGIGQGLTQAAGQADQLADRMGRVADEADRGAKNLQKFSATQLIGDLDAVIGRFSSGFGGLVAGFGAYQLAQTAIQAGQLGAQNLILARSYETLAAKVNIAADSLINRLKRATQNTVSEMILMSDTNLLLTAAQGGQIKITEQQIETLAKFARLRATQLPGLTAESAYGRLISGIVKRETELLDELGLTTRGIAAAIGVEVETINRDVDGLLRGIVKLAEQDIARFGEPALDESAKIQQAFVRIDESWERIRQSLARPVSVVVDIAADVIETSVGSAYQGVVDWRVLLGMADLEDATARIRELLNPKAIGTRLETFIRGDNLKRDDLQEVLSVIEAFDNAIKAGVPGLQEWRGELTSIAVETSQYLALTDEQIAKLQEIETAIASAREAQEASRGVDPEVFFDPYDEALDRVDRLIARFGELNSAPGFDNFSRQVQALATDLAVQGEATEAESKRLAELEQWATFAASGLAAYSQANTESASTAANNAVATEEAAAATRSFTIAAGGGMVAAGNLSGAIMPIPGQMDDVTASTDEATAALRRFQLAKAAAAQAEFTNLQNQLRGQALTQAKSVIPIVGIDEANAMFEKWTAAVDDQVRNLQAARDRGDITQAQLELGIAGFANNMTEPFERIKEAERERERAAREAESAGRRGARETESAWKQAARAVQSEFEKAASELTDNLRKVPGLFGRSQVTQEQLDLARLGVGQNFADDYLRRLEDEVFNNKDWADVSIEEARAALERVGITVTGNMEADVKLFAQAWEDMSLFANDENLKFINEAAIQASLDLQEKIKKGQQNIIDRFGATVETLTGKLSDEDLDALVQAKFDEIMAEKRGGGIRGAVVPPESEFEQLFASTLAKILGPGVTADGTPVEPVPIPVDAPESIPLDAPDSIPTDAPESIPVDAPVSIPVVMPQALPQKIEMVLPPELKGGRLSIAELIVAEAAIDKLISDIAGQFASKGALIKGQGAGYANLLDLGFTEYTHADLAHDFFTDIGGQLQAKLDGFKGQGGGVALAHDLGYIEAERLDLANDMFLDVGTQFQAQIDNFKGQGAAVAGLQDQGYIEAERADLASGMLKALTRQFTDPTHVEYAKGIGLGLAQVIDVGMLGYDFSGTANTVLVTLRSGFASEENLNLLLGTGGAVMQFIRDGMLREVNQPGWGQVIFDAVVGAVMDGATESLAGS